MTTEKIILPEDPEAAQYKTVTGWVSRKGEFYGDDERLARYVGSTHRKCGCGNIIEKRSWCKPCNKKASSELYMKKPFKEWDGETPLYSESFGEYFFSEDDIINFIENGDAPVNPDDLQLVICIPNKPHIIEEDEFMDNLPDNMESLSDVASPEFMIALEELNAILENEEWGWTPGNFRTTYNYEQDSDND